MKFTKEQIRKAMACKTVEELLAYAQSEGVEFSREQAEEYIAQLGENALTEDELAQVAGGFDICETYSTCQYLGCDPSGICRKLK